MREWEADGESDVKKESKAVSPFRLWGPRSEGWVSEVIRTDVRTYVRMYVLD